MSALTAVGEALTNAIEHGSERDSRRTVSVEAFADGNAIRASVSDAGRWASDSAASRRAANRGRGLTLIHGLCHDVHIMRTSLGTRVSMRHLRREPAAEATR